MRGIIRPRLGPSRAKKAKSRGKYGVFFNVFLKDIPVLLPFHCKNFGNGPFETDQD